ncbi:sirohydrochlorin chelatase [Alkalilimnicola ehrlichii]|nr:CbiX/SirB N-terminal domain-containing protein [Alkalilimnicola ehrlichii]
MRALLILAHGSRREASNDEVRELARMLASRLDLSFSRVDAAFLELTSPTIDQAVDEAVAAGATQVVLYPYFLAAGRHVAEDIPAIVDRCRSRHPAVAIDLRPYLGASPALIELLINELSA